MCFKICRYRRRYNEKLLLQKCIFLCAFSLIVPCTAFVLQNDSRRGSGSISRIGSTLKIPQFQEATSNRRKPNANPNQHQCKETKMCVAKSSTTDDSNVSKPSRDNDKSEAILTLDEGISDYKNELLSSSTSRFRKLKDIMWVRETLEDLTAAEFACSIESAEAQQGKNNRRRAVDYDKILLNMNRLMRELGCNMAEGNRILEDSSIRCSLMPGIGVATTVYTDDEREALLVRILNTRENILKVIERNKVVLEQDYNAPFFPNLELPDLPEFPEILVGIPKDKSSIANNTTATKVSNNEEAKNHIASNSTSNKEDTDPGIYVRGDGTIDWDGALQDKAALKKFGKSVWARINGQDPDSAIDNDSSSSSSMPEEKEEERKAAVTAKIKDTPEIQNARLLLTDLKDSLKEAETSHTALLNSALNKGQAIANVNLATVEPLLRSLIRDSASKLETMKLRVTYQQLIYELERIFSYLVGELGNSGDKSPKGYIPLQDRLNVAEFGLLESQINSFKRILETEDGDYGMIDNDLIAVVSDQMMDLKKRLGIDFLVSTGVSFDPDAIKSVVNDVLIQAKKGLDFYVKGTQLLWNDIMFCLSLIGRAVQGYTLKPREVRNIRRTFKDIFTFIPCVIILIIPISPIGHVLVFGAIQRFFPDFFPSCFTEQRQNLLELYENAEYSEVMIKENWQEKFVRILEAVGFFVVSQSRILYATTVNELNTNVNSYDDDIESAEVNTFVSSSSSDTNAVVENGLSNKKNTKID